jgi:hypothetical protein
MASIISAGTTSGTSLNLSGDTSGVLQLASNGSTTAVTIDTSQRVGIGTTTPDSSTKLEVSGGQFRLTASSASSMFLVNPSTTYADGVDIQATYNGAGSFGPLKFTTSGTERMRIDSNGAILINSTSSTYAPLLQTTGDAGVNNLTVVKNTGTSYSTGVRLVTFVNSSDAIAGVISHSGVTSVTYGTSSDQRLKENIVDAPNALDKVMDIKIRSYDWKEDSSHVEYGLVAQELHSVYDEPVGVGGEDITKDAWSIEYGRLTPILLKAIQELNAKVEAQAVRIAELEGAK